MKKYLEQIVVAEFLLFSGGIIFCQIYPALSLVIFVFTTFIYYLSQKKSIPLINKKILLFIILWVLLVQFVFVGERSDNRDLPFILNPLGVFFVLSSISFNRFRDILLQQLTILSAISIVIQIGYDIGLFMPTPLTPAGVMQPYYMCCYLFSMGWELGTKITRLSSIYWEPGQFQIIIMFTLSLFVDQLRNIAEWKSLLKKFGIIVLALFMTISTMGYMVFALLIFCVLFYSKSKRYESWNTNHTCYYSSCNFAM